MKLLDFLILIVLFSLLIASIYLFYNNLPTEPMNFEDYKFEGKNELNSNGIQFYPNMRYKDRTISFAISNSCDEKTRNSALKAFSMIDEKSIITFQEEKTFSNAEITVLCSEIAPKPEEEGHFVAGEGGPSEVINNTNFAVILSGRVSLFRANECDEPIVAIHEILHALGFDHNNNSNSIMYPLTKCSQNIDDYIIDSINTLYQYDSIPDLLIEKVKAQKVGRYLSFEVTLSNFGLKDSNNSELFIEIGGEIIKSFEIAQIEIGTRRILTVENIRVPKDSSLVLFNLKYSQPELDKKNNDIEVKLLPV